jgi:hypothetical protein
VLLRICEALLSDLEQAGLIERDRESRIVVVSLKNFAAGSHDLLGKLKTFRHEGERAHLFEVISASRIPQLRYLSPLRRRPR